MWWNSKEIKTNYWLKTLFLFVILSLLSGLYYNFELTQHWLWHCPIYKTTGLQCATCGFQRAFHQLLHGNFRDSFQYNILFIPTLFIVLGLYYFPKKEHLILVLKWYLPLAFLFMLYRNF